MGLKLPGVQISVFCAGGCPHCEGAEREREIAKRHSCLSPWALRVFLGLGMNGWLTVFGLRDYSVEGLGSWVLKFSFWGWGFGFWWLGFWG